MIISKSNRVARRFLRSWSCFALVLVITASVVGAPIGMTPLAVTPGAPAGSYSLSGFENINLYNGHLGFALPLLEIGGRGKVAYTITLGIAKRWMVTNAWIEDDGYFPGHYAKSVESLDAYPRLTHAAYPNISLPLKEVVASNFGPGTLYGTREGTSIRNSHPPYNPIYVSSLSRFTFVLPDGTEYELRDKNTNGSPYEWQGLTPPPAFQRGTEFVTSDGNSITFVSDTPIQDLRPGSISNPVPYCNETNCSRMTPSGALFLADGTRYDITQGRVTRISDTNGNQITFSYTTYDVTYKGISAKFTALSTITDPLERTVTLSYGLVTGNTYDELEYKGVGAVPRRIRIYRTQLSEALRSDNTAKTWGQLFPELTSDSTLYTCQVVSSVELPNQRSYSFNYNSYGELAKIKLPTGGAIEYDTTGGIEGGTSSGIFGDTSGYVFSTNESFIYRRVLKRRVIEGEVLRSITTYGRSDTTGGPHPSFTSPLPYIQVNTFNPTPGCEVAGTCERLSHERHFFYASAAQSYSGSTVPSDFKKSRYPTWNEGREFKTQSYHTDGSTLLRQVEFKWSQPHVGWWSGLNFQQALEPPNNTRMVETVTTLADTNQVMKQTAIDPGDPSGETIAFDQYNNQTDVWEYDYGTGAPGALRRHTHTQFVDDPAYVCSPSSTFSPCESINGAHLRRLPQGRQVYAIGENGTETLVQQNETKYDEAPLTAYAAVSNLTDPGRSERGNATKIREWLDQTATTPNVTNRWLESLAAYDQCGNVVKTTAPLGQETTAVYTDADGQNSRNNHAFPTLAASAIPDPSGQHGSNSALVTTREYDFWTGLVTANTGAQGQVTRVEYNDALSRPTRVIPPAGGSEVTFEYEDDPQNLISPGTVFTKVRKQIDEAMWEEGFTYYDGLGRVIKSQSRDALGDIFSETVYDALGRTSKSSGTYRPGEEKHWVETIYDSLGRPKEIISPKIGNEPQAAKIRSEYSSCALGLVYVGVNQAGNKARSITNSLGQVVRVDEPNEANDFGSIENPTQPTYYKYDALGNLRQVTQQNQSRYFLYDSLGRLIRVSQPEQEPNPDLAIEDPLTGNGQWSTGFTYDDNGNLSKTTDAKGVITESSFDHLNRPYQRIYSVPQTTDLKKITANTTTVTLKYDGLVSPSPNNPNPVLLAFAKGVLTEISNGFSTTQHTSFNNLGRIISSQQITDGQVYTSSYEYNLVGALKTQTYPSGRLVTYAFDNAGDLSSVKSNLTNQAEKTYASNFRYTASGGVDQIQLGNGRWETYKLNARQQVTQIALGTSPTDTSLWKVDYEYGRLNQDGTIDLSKNDGNVLSQTITVPGTASPFIQSYKYDSLNRLTEARETSGSSQNWKQSFGYDAHGNRTGFSYLIGQTAVALNNVNHPAIDPLTNRFQAGQGYAYDLNGNLILDAAGTKYLFDGDNRQTEVKMPNDTVLATYAYDGSGRRIKKTVMGTQETTIFVYDAGGKLLAEYSSTNQPARTSYITADILNSPRVITDSAGQLISRRDFMPFGESIAAGRSTDQKYGINDGLRKSFTGYERDNETQLDFAEARYYNPMQGRFTTVDPLMTSGRSTNPQTFNRYVYAGNNPTLRVDPNGTDWYISEPVKLVGTGSARILTYEWHSTIQFGKQIARNYLVYFNHGELQGLYALDKFENDYTPVSSVAEGRAQLEKYKRQAMTNFVYGALETNSLILELAEVPGVNRNSEMYKAGKNTGRIYQGVAAVTGAGLTNLVFTKFGKAGVSILREAVAGFRVGNQTVQEIAVIGRIPATLYRMGQSGTEVFSMTKGTYTLAENMRWIDQLIEQRVVFELVSAPTKANRFTKSGQLTVFGQELKRLEDAGYRQWHNFMLPPSR